MLVGTKVLVFALFCSAATLNPFLTLILQDNNFTAQETGTLISFSKVIALVCTPLVCALADSFHCHSRLLIVLSLAGAGLMVLWAGFLPTHRADELSARWRPDSTPTPAGGGLPGAHRTDPSSRAPQGSSRGVGSTASVHPYEPTEANSPMVVFDGQEGAVIPAILADVVLRGDNRTQTEHHGGDRAEGAAEHVVMTGPPRMGEDEGRQEAAPSTTTTAAYDRKGRVSSEVTTAASIATASTTARSGGTTQGRPRGRRRRGTVVDLAAVLTAILLGVYQTISGSKSVITDTLVMRRLERAVAVGKEEEVKPGADPPPELAPLSEGRHPTACTAEEEKREIDTTAAYPMQRLWGSMSYGLTASLTGVLVKLLDGVAVVWVPGQRWHTMGLLRSSAAPHARRQPYLIVPLIHALSLLLFAAIVFVVVVGRTRRRRVSDRGASGTAEAVADTEAGTLAPHSSTLPQHRRWVGPAALLPSASGGLQPVAPPQDPLPTAAAMPRMAICSRQHAVHAVRLCLARCRSMAREATAPSTTVRVYAFLLRNPSFVLPLFCGVFFLTLGEMATWIFLFPYARRELKATPQLFALIMLVHMVSEVGAFTLCSVLLRRRKLFHIFFTSAICYAGKLYLYSVIRDPWWLLPLEALHGPCSAFKLTATVAHVTACAREAERFFATALAHPGQPHALNAGVGKPTGDEDATRADTGQDFVNPSARFTHDGTPTSGACAAEAPRVELLSTAFSIMWLAATGLPAALTGLLPFLAAALMSGGAGVGGPAGQVSTPPVGGEGTTSSLLWPRRRDPVEPTLFRAVSAVLLVVAGLFAVYHRLGMFQ